MGHPHHDGELPVLKQQRHRDFSKDVAFVADAMPNVKNF